MTITQLPNGRFDVQDEAGRTLLGPFGGPFYTSEMAETTARMLGAFERVDEQIQQINDGLREAK